MKPCSICHEIKDYAEFFRRTSSADGYQRICKPCVRLAQKEWRGRNKPKLDAFHRQWRSENPDYFKHAGIKHHGITVDEFSDLVSSQHGRCAICASKPSRLNVDHDHDHCPGAYGCRECVRGLLCTRCNTGEDRVCGDLWTEYINRPRPFASTQVSK